MDEFESGEKSLVELQRERTVLDVLRYSIWEKDTNGRNYSIAKACEKAGISYSTWKNWVQDGLVTGPLQQAAQEFYQSTYGQILPYYAKMVEGLINLAQGKRPDDSDIDKVTPADMIAAFRELSKIVPVQPMDQATGGKKSELEHLEGYQPKQVMVVNGDFIYQGQSGARMGQLPSITEDEENFDEL